MHLNLKQRNKVRKKRALRVRKKLIGTATRPRLSVHKTLKHLAVQLIDDERGITLASASTLTKEMNGMKKSKESARLIGEKIAELALEQKIEEVVFDRGRYKYHGVIAVLADAAREKGMKF